jgi:hypothetical protein
MGGGATNNKARQAASAAWRMGVSASKGKSASVAASDGETGVAGDGEESGKQTACWLAA